MTDRGRQYENRLAKERDLEKQPFSGAGVFKEDLIGKWEVIQAKSTGNGKTYQMERRDMINVIAHAARTGRIGVLYLEWDTEEYVMMRRTDYEAHVSYEPVIICTCCCEQVDQALCIKCSKSTRK